MEATQTKEVVSPQENIKPVGRQENSVDLIKKLGGFSIVKGVIPAAVDMDPERKAAKSIFMTEARFKPKRKALAEELKMWIELLGEDAPNGVSDLIKICDEKENTYQQCFEKNVGKALEATKQLETAYRSLDSFFKNAGEVRRGKVQLLNVNNDAVKNTDAELLEKVDLRLKDGFDVLDLRESFSLLVIPGDKIDWSKKGFADQWANMAHKYKVMLVSDHAMETSFDDLCQTTSDYKSSGAAYQHVVVTGNWIAARDAEEYSEMEKYDGAFFIPPSAALAGKMYNEAIPISQAPSGERFGTLMGTSGVKLSMYKSEIGRLIDNGLVPIVYSGGRVMAYSNKTLFDGDNKSLQEYSIVRVEDWLRKVMMHFVHKVHGENWNSLKSPNDLRRIISDFLSQYKGSGKLFESFDVGEPVQDKMTKEINLKVTIKPFFAANNFNIAVKCDEDGKTDSDTF